MIVPSACLTSRWYQVTPGPGRAFLGIAPVGHQDSAAACYVLPVHACLTEAMTGWGTLWVITDGISMGEPRPCQEGSVH